MDERDEEIKRIIKKMLNGEDLTSNEAATLRGHNSNRPIDLIRLLLQSGKLTREQLQQIQSGNFTVKVIESNPKCPDCGVKSTDEPDEDGDFYCDEDDTWYDCEGTKLDDEFQPIAKESNSVDITTAQKPKPIEVDVSVTHRLELPPEIKALLFGFAMQHGDDISITLEAPLNPDHVLSVDWSKEQDPDAAEHKTLIDLTITGAPSTALGPSIDGNRLLFIDTDNVVRGWTPLPTPLFELVGYTPMPHDWACITWKTEGA